MSFPFIFSLCLVCDENTHQYAKLVYFSSFMLIFQFGWACSQISHLSAIPALAQNQNERTSLTAIRYSVTIMSQVMVYLTGMTLFFMIIGLGNFQDFMSFTSLIVLGRKKKPSFEWLNNRNKGFGNLIQWGKMTFQNDYSNLQIRNMYRPLIFYPMFLTLFMIPEYI